MGPNRKLQIPSSKRQNPPSQKRIIQTFRNSIRNLQLLKLNEAKKCEAYFFAFRRPLGPVFSPDFLIISKASS